MFAEMLKYPPVCRKTNASAGAAGQIKDQNSKCKTTMQKSKIKPIGPDRAYLHAVGSRECHGPLSPRGKTVASQ